MSTEIIDNRTLPEVTESCIAALGKGIKRDEQKPNDPEAVEFVQIRKELLKEIRYCVSMWLDEAQFSEWEEEAKIYRKILAEIDAILKPQ